MKKIISCLVVAFVALSASFAIDSASIQKACESFLMDKNAICLKATVHADGEKGVVLFRASEVSGFAFSPADVGISFSENASNDVKRLFRSLKCADINSAVYSNGVLSIEITVTR